MEEIKLTWTYGAASVRKIPRIFALHEAALRRAENFSINAEASGARITVADPALPFLMCLPILDALGSSNDDWLGSSNGGACGAALARVDDQLLAVVGYCTLDGGTEWQSSLTAAGGAGISLPGLSLLVLDSIL